MKRVKEGELKDKRKIMIRKVGSPLRQICNAIVLAGIIILFIGLYYLIIKAGIPYQDPPIELQIKYAINMGIAETLIKNGFQIAICGGVAHILLVLMLNKQKENKD